ncbi:MAG: hypothetical protein K0S93_185 [Nitrososphaeraceae archaeon]|jgi:hypothetical protein|nr:hypothetical protein [Nitrososphaeraceae archaeon]
MNSLKEEIEKFFHDAGIDPEYTDNIILIFEKRIDELLGTPPSSELPEPLKTNHIGYIFGLKKVKEMLK